MIQVKPLVHGLFSLIQNNSTAMLATASVGGLTATALLSAKAAPQALDEIYNKSEGHPENVDLLGKIRMTWKIWLPPISVGALTVVCIVAMNSIHLRRQAALASALTLMESAAAIYQDKVIELVDPKTREKIEGAVAQEQVTRAPISKQVVLVTGKGESLILDTLSGRYFKGDVDRVHKAVNEFNKRLINGFGVWLPVNEFYQDLSIDGNEMGDLLGWQSDRMLEVRFDAALTENEEACLVLHYETAPRPWK